MKSAVLDTLRCIFGTRMTFVRAGYVQHYLKMVADWHFSQAVVFRNNLDTTSFKFGVEKAPIFVLSSNLSQCPF